VLLQVEKGGVGATIFGKEVLLKKINFEVVDGVKIKVTKAISFA